MSLGTEFRWPIRVYYESTDAGGVVYHAEYLKFFERARTEWLRSLGVEQAALRAEDGVLFVVHAMQLKYVLPAKFDDLLEVRSRLLELGRVRLVFEQTLLRGETILNQATVDVVCVADVTFKPTSLPAHIRHKFESALS